MGILLDEQPVAQPAPPPQPLEELNITRLLWLETRSLLHRLDLDDPPKAEVVAMLRHLYEGAQHWEQGEWDMAMSKLMGVA